MSSSDAQQIEELEKELREVNAKNGKLEKELQEGKAKKERLEKELRELKKDHQQHRVHRRRRRILPAELKVEIVDCFPVENAAHFLANVPNRLIIHHCSPRVRRMLKMIQHIATDYTRTLPAPNSYGKILLRNGHKYTPEMDIFLRYGAVHCRSFVIWRIFSDSFVGHPVNFFDNLIKHYYGTKVLGKAVPYVHIELSIENPAPWPMALVQPQAGEINVEESKVYNIAKCVLYILYNKHNPGIAFKLYIYFEEDAKCYQQMTYFRMKMIQVQSGAA